MRRSPAASPIGTTSRSISRGRDIRIGGNGFCGCSRRTLLLLLQERARALGVELIFQHRVRRSRRIAPMRSDRRGRRHQQPRPRRSTRSISSQRSIFARTSSPGWARRAASTPSPSSSSETEHGVFIAHCYQYEAGHSTWVIETDPDTYVKAGLDRMDEAASARFLEGDLRRGARRP